MSKIKSKLNTLEGRLRLGLEIGSRSIGWWLYGTTNGHISSVVDGGVRFFSDGREAKTGISLAETRRNARLKRRRRDRYLRRRKALIDLLVKAGIFPASSLARKNLCGLNPYKLRVQALDYKIPLEHFARLLFHLNQRRGYRDETVAASSGEEKSRVREFSTSLDEQMKQGALRTYGEYLVHRELAARQNGEIVAMRLKSDIREAKELDGQEWTCHALVPPQVLV